LCIAHSAKLPPIATGTISSHSQVGCCIRLTHQAIAEMPAAYITPTWSKPLYQGLIPATYCSRNRRCRSVIMESPLALCPIADILDVYQVAVKESRESAAPPRRRSRRRRASPTAPTPTSRR
jgi:hypothetical protein